MKTTLDRFGRVVVPKLLRDRLGLRAGTAIEIDEENGRLQLRRLDDTSPVTVRDGILVFTGTANGDVEAAVADEREARLRHVSGMHRR